MSNQITSALLNTESVELQSTSKSDKTIFNKNQSKK